MKVRTKQILAVVGGVVAAAVFIVLGLWQMGRFQLSMQDVAVEREAMEVVELAPHVHEDGSVDDIYGRRVVAEGEYLPEFEEVVGTTEARVVTAFELGDGRHVAVVRGTVSEGEVPPPPEGVQTINGIFTASDHPDSGQPEGSVRLQKLVQEWPTPLFSGYMTLSEDQSVAQGLTSAEARLPQVEGTEMHRGYALQWWVFAAASVAFGIFLAKQFRAAEDKRLERIAARRKARAEAAAVVNVDEAD